MSSLTIALAQINPTVGALEQNADLIVERAAKAAESEAQLVVFPELALSGYPPEDLVLKRHFAEDVHRQLLRVATALPPGLIALVGLPLREDDRVYNAAAVLQGGEVRGFYRKMRLPNYGVFDEMRVFAEGDRPLVLTVGGLRIGVHICEDSWSTSFAACRQLEGAHLDALVNLSASPFHRGKGAHRRSILASAASFLNTPLLYCNLVGGQDELIFDGNSVVLDADGKTLASGASFKEDLVLHTVSGNGESEAPAGPWDTLVLETTPGRPAASATSTSRPEAGTDEHADVYQALCLGLSDYVNKNGFERVVIAISGGIDSALVAAVAVDALGKDRVVGVTMPSRFSSDDTHGDAQELAHRLGIPLHDIPIRRLHELYLEELAPLWPEKPADTTEENLQARIRGNIVMALSNKFGWLVLTTGNKSEMATGYCTLYGDMAGGFAVIKDVPKTLVFDLCRWRNARSAATPPIPESIIDRPPSAELRENQKDEDSLPPYAILDPIIERYVERDWSAEQVVADGFDAAIVRRVIQLVDGNEYKRRQGPPGIKITPKAFGRDRRLPITNLYHERVKPARAPKKDLHHE